ncbi:hypothetical protein OG417_12505 [Actinoallomurus sp. NBC_01490]|jgi:ribose transport system permease protein|uniref:hypothetical protein n=1 Tax=Actinoallomurus sp. NBC_01490 TaxID=2903557 RepID=UPI002E3644B0|nr:hypothetical protein [Actinoallomurus sp. NBC_01490]
MFETIAAVMVGGTSVQGARVDYWRTVLGALLSTLMTTILIGSGVSDAVEQVIFGALILVVVFGYGRGRAGSATTWPPASRWSVTTRHRPARR